MTMAWRGLKIVQFAWRHLWTILKSFEVQKRSQKEVELLKWERGPGEGYLYIYEFHNFHFSDYLLWQLQLKGQEIKIGGKIVNIF
jgi:hypothetical protein